MAKPGDIVEFKAGLHGQQAPHNLGILLSRERRKGVPWVRVCTLAGARDMKQEHLTRRAFRRRYDGDLRDEAETTAALRRYVEAHAGGRLAEEAEDDLGALEEALWQATCETGRDAWTEEGLAAVHYGEASPQQLRDVRAALARCRRPGVGRFETVAGRGDTWRPWTRAEHDAMRRAWDALHDLRRRLVRVEETEEGRIFVRVGFEEVGRSDGDRATLAWVRAAMAQYVEHDGVPEQDVAGLGGLGAVQAFGMDLHGALGFLAQDWIRSPHTTRSSDYVHFLLESGLWTPDDAVAALMRRHVNREPFFEHIDDPDAEAAAAAFSVPDEPGGPTGPLVEGDAADREDLRALECYTIDPPDARDFDDAVGVEDLGEGRTRLWVHIADVSHYVRPGTPLDRHARKRATSVYLPGRVLPMLPRRLSDDICSLRSDGDRYAVSAALDVALDGSVERARFTPSLIRVRENLSYDEALRRARAGQPPFGALLALAERMRLQRRGLELETGELRVLLESSGFSALEKRADDATRMIETFMVAANVAVATHLAANGTPLPFRCHPLPDAGKAGRFAHQAAVMGMEVAMDLPVVPGGGASEAMGGAAAGEGLLERLRAGGGRLELFGGGVSLRSEGARGGKRTSPPQGDEGRAADVPTRDAAAQDGQADGAEAPVLPGFAQLDESQREAWLAPFRAAVAALAALGDRGLADVATGKLLACMGRAHYTDRNEGHFGLAATHYCHFTSPIRRYPDILVHRNLKALLSGEVPPHDAKEIGVLCDHCSDQERAADGLERRVRNACLVLASLHGENAASQAPGRITGLTPAACFVVRDDGIEARVPARDLPGGPYHVDEWESMLFVSDVEAPQRFGAAEAQQLAAWLDEESGELRRVRARLGDRVTVRLAGRDVAEGRTGAQVVAWHA